MSYPRQRGMIAAPFTAFRSDGPLDLSAIGRQAEKLVQWGVTGVFVCGTTGEGPSLTTAERKAVAAAWCEASAGRLKVLVHVGHNAVQEAAELAAHAEVIGADGVGCMAPYFFKPAGSAELVEYCAHVAAAAPGLPFYYYHIPSMTGVNIPVAQVLRDASTRIPNLAGAKFTFENMMDLLECQQLDGGRYDIIFGRDEMLLAGLSMGVEAAIGSTYNFMAPYFTDLLNAYAAGDLARAKAAQIEANEIIAIFLKHGGMNAGKAMMEMIGVDCGPCRTPLRTLTAEQKTALRADLTAAGFFQRLG